MMTEEKLKNFLDDLRFGKYDTADYKLQAYGVSDCVSLTLENVTNNVILYLTLYQSKPYKYVAHRLFGFYWESKKKEHVQAYATISYTFPSKGVSIDISDELYDSFSKYVLEQKEKIKLVEDSNREATFGL